MAGETKNASIRKDFVDDVIHGPHNDLVSEIPRAEARVDNCNRFQGCLLNGGWRPSCSHMQSLRVRWVQVGFSLHPGLWKLRKIVARTAPSRVLSRFFEDVEAGCHPGSHLRRGLFVRETSLQVPWV